MNLCSIPLMALGLFVVFLMVEQGKIGVVEVDLAKLSFFMTA